MKKILCFILVFVISLLTISTTLVRAADNEYFNKVLIDAVEKYTSSKFDSLKINKILKGSKSDNVKYKEIKRIYDNAKNSFNERWAYEGLLNSEMYVAYQFKKDLDENIIKRGSLGLSALVFNDEAIDYVMGKYPEKDKYKQMLKDFMRDNKEYFECLTYSNEIQSFLSDCISSAQDIIPKGKLTKLYGSLENATNRSHIDKAILDVMNEPSFKNKDGKYIFKSNLPKALDMAGDVICITSSTLEGVQDICYAVSNIETYKMYEEFLNYICNYKKDGKYMMPYAMRSAAYSLQYEMQGEFQAVIGNVLPLLQDYMEFGMEKVVDITELTAKPILSSITTGISISKVIGNVVLGMEDIVNSAAYVEGYAYLGELYSEILAKSKLDFLSNPSIENAEKFKQYYSTLWSIRKKGEEMFLDMASFKNAWAKNYLKSWTGYLEKEKFCNETITRLQNFRFNVIMKFGDKDLISGSENSEGINVINLLDGYWESNIQCRKIYKFLENGRVKEYDIEPNAAIKKENLNYSGVLQYHINGNKLVIERGNGFQIILEPVTTDSPIQWDLGLSYQIAKIPDETVFFYETGWSDSGNPYDVSITSNAMYLSKSKKTVRSEK